MTQSLEGWLSTYYRYC